MNANRAHLVWKWAVLLLLLCNVGLILTIWFRKGPEGGPRHESPRDMVIRELKFSNDQVKAYDELIKVHHSSMERLRKGSMEYRELLFNDLHNEPSGINTDSLAQLIAANQKQVETVTYTHFRQVRALCTNEQKAEFDKIIMDVIKKMNSGMHGPPPGRDDDQGPPPNQREDDDHHHPDDGNGPPPGPPRDN